LLAPPCRLVSAREVISNTGAMGMTTIPYDKAGAAKLRKAKPSELILIALEDLVAVERQRKKFRVDMWRWFVPNSPRHDGKCVVCLAGSVMAGTLAVPHDTDIVDEEGWVRPEHVDGASICQRLQALDDARYGGINSYLSDLKRRTPKALENVRVPIPVYADDPSGFKSGLRKMAQLLAEHGL
jgi:hypothetical protein